MASATQKVRKIRSAKKVSQGARRKREIRRDARIKAAQVAEMLGLSTAGQLASEEAPKA
jgi:hypothetical protein